MNEPLASEPNDHTETEAEAKEKTKLERLKLQLEIKALKTPFRTNPAHWISSATALLADIVYKVRDKGDWE